MIPTNISLKTKGGNVYQFLKILGYSKENLLYEYKIVFKKGGSRLIRNAAVDKLSGIRIRKGIHDYYFSGQTEISYHALSGNITYKDAKKNYNLSPRYRFPPLNKIKRPVLFFQIINLPIDYIGICSPEKHNTEAILELGENYLCSDRINCDVYITHASSKVTVPRWSKQMYPGAKSFCLEDKDNQLYLVFFIYKHMGRDDGVYFAVPTPGIKNRIFKLWMCFRLGRMLPVLLDFMFGWTVGLPKYFRTKKNIKKTRVDT